MSCDDRTTSEVPSQVPDPGHYSVSSASSHFSLQENRTSSIHHLHLMQQANHRSRGLTKTHRLVSSSGSQPASTALASLATCTKTVIRTPIQSARIPRSGHSTFRPVLSWTAYLIIINPRTLTTCVAAPRDKGWVNCVPLAQGAMVTSGNDCRGQALACLLLSQDADIAPKHLEY